jgi:hypothetical protein
MPELEFLFVQLIPQILPRSDMRSPALTFNQTVSAFCFRNYFRFLTSEITSASLLQKSLPLPYFRNHFRFLTSEISFLTSEITSAFLLQKSFPLPYFRNHFRFLTSEITSASLLQKSLPLPYFRNHFRFLTSCSFFLNIFLWDFFSFSSYNIQHCFICRPSDSTVPTDAGIEPRTVATCALAVRRSNH